MTPKDWLAARQSVSLTQVQAAKALGITQPYLSQLETGARAAGKALARKAAALYRLPPTRLPLSDPDGAVSIRPDDLQRKLAALGYPKFAHVRSGAAENPAPIVFGAVVQRNLDTRLVEALPWVLITYTDLDWPWLRDHVKLRNAQNRLGYLVHLARNVAESAEGRTLTLWEQDLEEARLAREDTLCRESMPLPERAWLKTHRPAAAAHWNLLTGIEAKDLPYAKA